MAAFERAQLVPNGRPYAVVLFETGRTAELSVKDLAREAARRLGIERIEWIA
jgi:hypothetical protein